MKKISLIATFALVCNFALAQIQETTYRGAFAPAPTAMWTDGWANFDPQSAIYRAPTVVLSNVIAYNRTLFKGTVYEIKGLTTVKGNATLTIEPGTVIVSNTPASALVITRGSKIIADGTAAEPIVFTSKNAVGSRNSGDWGGIVILGKSHLNISAAGVNNIEGITPSTDTQFGGGTTPDVNDNSGILRYVRIEYGGFVFAPNNELNGLTLGAVGAGTTIDYVQVSYSNDDSFEWFGGSVNGKHLVAFNGIDDDFDTDNGYSGVNQFVLGIKDPNKYDISTSEGFESDNSGTSSSILNPRTKAIFSNVTLVGPTGKGVETVNSLFGRAIRLRRSTELSIFNSIIVNFPRGLGIEDAITLTNAQTNDKLRFKNNIIAGVPTNNFIINTATVPASTELSTWFNSTGTTGNNNTTNTSSDGVLVKAANGTNYVTSSTSSDGLIDYRPGTAASTGASFTDSYLTAYTDKVGPTPVTTATINYCVGAVAAPLTATLTTTGTALKWYTSITGAASSVAPTPATRTAGIVKYYVAQESIVDGVTGVSEKFEITVNIIANPVVTFLDIKSVVGGDKVTPITDITALIGNGLNYTYTTDTVLPTTGVPATQLTYLWSVPAGVTLVSGQGTKTIVVNFSNLLKGTKAIGYIRLKAANASNCTNAGKYISLTATLPTTPATLTMSLSSDTNNAAVTTGFISSIGTTTQYTLTAGASANATSFLFDIPSSKVNVPTTGLTATAQTAVLYNTYPFTTPIATPPTGSAAIYYAVTETKYTNAENAYVFSKYTATWNQIAGTTNTETVLASTGNPVTNVTKVGQPISPAFPYYASSGTLSIDFSPISDASTANVAVIMTVRGKNNNAMSAARSLSLSAKLPSAPTAVTGQLLGLCPELSYAYTIADTNVANNATKFEITGPEGSVVTSASQPTNATNVLTTLDVSTAEKAFTVTYPVGFSTATAKTIAVKSRNGLGKSLAARIVALKTGLATPVVPVGSTVTSVTRCDTPVTFTVTDAATTSGVTNYVWSVRDGATIVSGQGTNTITVNFKSVLATKTSTYVYVLAKNACNVSSATKSINVTVANCPAPTRYAQNKNNVSDFEIIPNPASNIVTFNVNATTNGTVNVAIYSLDGNIVSESNGLAVKAGVNSFTENVSRLNSGIYVVKITNSTTNEVQTAQLIKN